MPPEFAAAQTNATTWLSAGWGKTSRNAGGDGAGSLAYNLQYAELKVCSPPQALAALTGCHRLAKAWSGFRQFSSCTAGSFTLQGTPPHLRTPS